MASYGVRDVAGPRSLWSAYLEYLTERVGLCVVHECLWLGRCEKKLGSDLEASPDASGGPAMDKGHTNRPTRCVLPISRQCQYRTRRDRDRQRPF